MQEHYIVNINKIEIRFPERTPYDSRLAFADTEIFVRFLVGGSEALFYGCHCPEVL